MVTLSITTLSIMTLLMTFSIKIEALRIMGKTEPVNKPCFTIKQIVVLHNAVMMSVVAPYEILT